MVGANGRMGHLDNQVWEPAEEGSIRTGDLWEEAQASPATSGRQSLIPTKLGMRTPTLEFKVSVEHTHTHTHTHACRWDNHEIVCPHITLEGMHSRTEAR